ncbi:transducin beta-like protein 3 [Halyomorpha halys]|uniref:transducin beta-like protein 3 n=1 Tax=Halyomorpha halys TaxID=286706 RepID=UPI0006D4EC0D|nr:transducin beta-like protein 3 [Halyomorpha halys]
MPSSKFKELFEAEFSLKSFYTGGDVVWTTDGSTFLCQCGGSVQFLCVESGKVNGFIGDEEVPTEDAADVDLILTFALSPNNEQIVSAHRSGLFKLWNFQDKTMVKHWRSVHKGPVAKLAITNDGLILASGGSDSSVRLWDMKYHACTKNLTGIKGVCSVLKFLEKGNSSLLFASGDDAIIKAWDIESGELKISLEGHYSKVTDIIFSNTHQHVVSCGRDKVIILWNIKSGEQMNVIPAYESLESLVILPDSITLPGADVKHQDGVYVATGGDRGVIRVWDVLNTKELYVQSNSLVRKSEEGGLALCHLLYSRAASSFALISYDHNIFVHSIDTFICTNQFVGYSDEILDLVYVGEDETHLAVATNSPDIKLFTLSSMSCSLLTGHTGFVVTLAVAPQKPNIFASASKDNSVRLWALSGKAGATCIASGMFHNSSACGLAFSQASVSFLLSGAEDNVLKLWKIPKKLEEHDGSSLMMKASCMAHEKDINAIAVSPNDKMVATASLDKTAKLWNFKDLAPLGTLRGHRRGIWSLIFSPVDQVVMTSSADTTIKIWSLSDLSCLKTLEGHESSVMKSAFLSRGLQVISASGDGLLKLWTIKTSECTASFDGHTGKIWALAVSKDESRMVTGCSASKIVFWKDVTEEKQLEEAKKRQEKALKEQELFNLIESDDFLSALKLALTLDRPATVLNIIKSVMKRGSEGLSQTILLLDQEEKQTLLKCASHWNMNSKTSYAAQFLVSLFLEEIACGKLKPPTSLVESIIPYTERHFNRLTQLMQELYLLEYTKTIMKPALAET